MASIFSLDKQVASLPKHGFPMSDVFDFTASSGMILPIYFDRLNPGEKIRYSVDVFTRTNPLSSPANVEIDEYVDLFFVPLKKLSAVADNILFQIDDVPSTFFKDGFTLSTSGYMFPLLDLSKIGCGDDSTASTYMPAFQTYVPAYGAVTSFYDTWVKGAMRLFDHLGIDPSCLIDPNPTTSLRYAPKISPEFFGVYQAIYYDYFRLSNWESNVVAAYNFDNAYDSMDLLTSSKSWAAGALNGTLKNLLQLHYRARNKDYFTNVFPSALIGTNGMLANGSALLSSVNQWLIGSGYSPVTEAGLRSYTSSATTTSPSEVSSFSPADEQMRLSTASLRTLFAVDKLLKVTGRAGKHYDDQVLAHFGFKVPRGFDGEVMHLGTHHQQIKIGEVISTASTQTGVLGELAGKGYARGVNQLVDNFVAPCHGYIMAVYSCAPKVSYVSALNRLHTDVLRYNWFIPELDNLGMQPLFISEQSMKSSSQAIVRYSWTLRYAQMKCKFNHATHAFVSRTYAGNISNDGPFADWVITDPYQYGVSPSVVTLGKLLVSPSDLNEVMLVGYDTAISYSSMADLQTSIFSPENLYVSDPLIVHVKNTVSKVTGMSIYGLDDKAI